MHHNRERTGAHVSKDCSDGLRKTSQELRTANNQGKMAKTTNEAHTSQINGLDNATKVASDKQLNEKNVMNKEKEMTRTVSGNAAQAASVEPKQWAKDMGIKGIRVKAIIDGKEKTIIVAHTEYGMRHEKKMDKEFAKADKSKLLTPRYHFCKPDIFWAEGYNLFDNNGEIIEKGTEDVLTFCDTADTVERIYIEDFLEDVEVHDFESVAEYAQHIGETALISRMPSKVEEMGIAAMATGDEAIKIVYEFAVDNNISYTNALGFLDAEMKPIVLKTMMRGIMPKSEFALGHTPEEAQQLFDAAKATFEADCKKRYVPRALNSLMKKHGQSLEVVIEALRTIPASEVTMAKLAECGEKESCIVGRLLMWILEMNRSNDSKAAA